MRTALTIVVPSYCGTRRLPALIGSLKPQMAEGDELIVVDDCSPDDTATVAEQLGARVVRLAVNSGVGAARNAGARAAVNDVLCFFDDDVLPVRGYLDKVRQVFADPAVQCAQGPHSLEPLGENPTIWERADALIWRHYGANLFIEAGRCQEFYSGATCVRRTLFLSLGGMSEAFAGAGGEEFEFAARLLACTEIHFVPELETGHRYKPLAMRLRTLYKRARNYPKVLAASPDFKPSARRGEMVRTLLANGGVAACLLTTLYPSAWLLCSLLITGFIIVDRKLYFDAWAWRRRALVPVLLTVRYLQYLAMALGVVRGIVHA